VKKVLLIVLGVLLAAFTGGQALQFFGFLGAREPSLAGISFIALGLAGSLACFQAAFKRPPAPEGPPPLPADADDSEQDT